MRKLPLIALAGISGLALAGVAVAASGNGHVMAVALPDGSTARVEYVGDVAPKVTIEPSHAVSFGDWAPIPAFAGLDRMFDQLTRQTEAMMREVEQVQRGSASLDAAPVVASVGAAPAGVTSTTIVSYSNGGSACTRTTETVSQGPGKPPKVRTSVSGNCAREMAPVPGPDAAKLNHT